MLVKRSTPEDGAGRPPGVSLRRIGVGLAQWRTSGASRVRERRLSLFLLFGATSGVGLVLFTILAVAGVDSGTNSMVVGLVLAMVLAWGAEVRSREGRTREVLLLDYRAHQFGKAIGRGVERHLNIDPRSWKTEFRNTGTQSADGALDWQIRQLERAEEQDLDALILIPAGNSPALWNVVARLIRDGTFVVVADTKPPNHVFRDIGVEPPRFVSPKFDASGLVIGEFLGRWLAADSSRSCILWNGPESSYPGEERSRNILYEVARAGQLGRCTLRPIDSWTPDAQRCRETLEDVRGRAGVTAVYCADDENAMALHMLTLQEAPELRARMFIVGCNGTPDDSGQVPVVAWHAVDATVDILAEELGVQAAMLLTQERRGRLAASRRTVFLTPRFILRTTAGREWDQGLDRSAAPPRLAIDTTTLPSAPPVPEPEDSDRGVGAPDVPSSPHHEQPRLVPRPEGELPRASDGD
ncbi:hypothetical protein [Patulibacter minatonensis]|uniref:hypothetical protein n=1 Tax=Patulibacter minatonensis TaxID=298163 RepID=UPI0012FA3911|nr:hypothetical protein [Patulibacter minatonensis]